MYRANVSRYKQNQVMLSSPGEILLALYDGAIRFARQARVAIENDDPAVKGEKIGSVMAILAELTATLDHEQAPEGNEWVSDRIVWSDFKKPASIWM